MAWRIDLQPNGFYSRFSDIVDDFTHLNLTRDEAVEVCLTEIGHRYVEEKVQSGERAGVARFYDDVERCRMVHGDATAQLRLEYKYAEDDWLDQQ